MKITNRKMYSLTALLLAAAVLSGCASKAQYAAAEAPMVMNAMTGKSEDYAVTETMAAAAMEEAYEMEAGSGISSSPTEFELSGSNMDADGKPSENDQTRKLIRNVDVSLQTLEFDAFTERIRQTVKELGGYIENSGVYGGSYYGSSRRNANITARIPNDRLDYFLNNALAGATVISMNENTEDITLRYTDLESKVETLEIEKDTLNSLLEKADSIETVIALESRLSEVRYELEGIRSSLKSYDNRVMYSTVWLYIEEVEVITPAKKATFGEKITTGFTEGTREFVEGLEDFAVWFISNIFSIAFTLLLIFGAFSAIRGIAKKCSGKVKKTEKRLFSRKKKTVLESADSDSKEHENLS